MTEGRDWYFVARRLSLVAFTLLVIWGVIQATGLYTIWNGIPLSPNLELFKQYTFIALWPVTYAPVWYKVVFFILGTWLLLPYLRVPDF